MKLYAIKVESCHAENEVDKVSYFMGDRSKPKFLSPFLGDAEFYPVKEWALDIARNFTMHDNKCIVIELEISDILSEKHVKADVAFDLIQEIYYGDISLNPSNSLADLAEDRISELVDRISSNYPYDKIMDKMIENGIANIKDREKFITAFKAVMHNFKEDFSYELSWMLCEKIMEDLQNLIRSSFTEKEVEHA